MPKKKRQSNIELLRILAIIGVVVLHYNNPSIGGGMKYAEQGSINFYTLYFLESMFVCAVDLFILISGYFMCNSKKINLWKPIELIIQVAVFKEAGYLLRVVMHSTPFSLKSMLASLIPSNYFVILYCCVFVLSPYINALIGGLSQKKFGGLICIVIMLFAVYPTVVDVLGELRSDEFIGLSSVGMYGSQYGYSIVNFILMYLVGAYLRLGNPKLLEWKTISLCGLLLLDIVLMTVWARVNDITGFFTERSAWEYCNPLVILEAVLLFILFSRLELGVTNPVNKLAEAVFSVFLLHDLFLPHIQIERFVKGNVFIMLGHMLLSAIIIYLICWGVHMIYHFIMDYVFKFLSDKIKLLIITTEN